MEAEDSQPMKIKVISLIFSGKLGVDWVDVGLEMWMKHMCSQAERPCYCVQLPQGEQWRVLDVPLLCMDGSLLSCATSGDKFLQHVLVESKKFLAEVKKVIGRCFGGKSVAFKVNFCPVFVQVSSRQNQHDGARFNRKWFAWETIWDGCFNIFLTVQGLVTPCLPSKHTSSTVSQNQSYRPQWITLAKKIHLQSDY